MSTTLALQPVRAFAETGSAVGDPRFQRLMAWPFEPLIERLVEKEGFSDAAAREIFADVKRFLWISSSYAEKPDLRLSPPERIDNAWHSFLLFTKAYRQFCKEHFGQFLHHQPFTREQRATMRASGTALKTLKATIAAAQDAFGTLNENWTPHLLRTAEAQFATDCEGCAPSTNCGGNDPSCW